MMNRTCKKKRGSGKTYASQNTDTETECSNGPFQDIRCFVLTLCSLGFVEGISANGLVNISLPSIETRFNLRSSQSGLIVSCGNFGGVMLVLFVSFYGGLMHKPRVVGFGSLVLAVGSFLFFMPHFLVGPYTYSAAMNMKEESICDSRQSNHCLTEDDLKASGSDSNFMPMFALANGIQGAGFTPVFTVACAYIDANANPGRTAFYVGVLYMSTAAGVAVGYVLGGQLLRIWVDVNKADYTGVDMDTADRRWVGAWWIGFVIAFVLYLIISPVMCAFPRHMKVTPDSESTNNKAATAPQAAQDEDPQAGQEVDTLAVQDEDPQAGQEVDTLAVQDVDPQAGLDEDPQAGQDEDPQAADDEDPQTCHSKNNGLEAASNKGIAEIILMLPFTLLHLIQNKPLMLLIVAGSAETLLAGGTSAFSAKIIKEKFKMSAAVTGVIMGCTVVLGAGGGMVLSGLIIRKLRLSLRGIVRMCLATILPASLSGAAFFIHCNHAAFAGLSKPYHGTSLRPPPAGLTAPCNAECACTTMDFDPVCGADGLTYFSACYAGCREDQNISSNFTGQEGANSQKHIPEVFVNCTCVGDSHPAHTPEAYRGECKEQCDLVWLFAILMFIGMFTTCMNTTPVSVGVLRLVPAEERSLGLGFLFLCLRILGAIPGPILTGTVIDNACEMWRSTCEGRGSCWIYSNSGMGWRLFTWWIAFKCVSLVALLLTHFLLPPDATEVQTGEVDLPMSNAARPLGSQDR